MPERLVLPVPAGAVGTRLDRFLVAAVPGWSRSQLARLVATGHVRVRDQVAVASHRLREGECVEVEVPDPAPSSLPAEDIPLRILHEDADLVVVDKQAGLVVHPGAGSPSGTLVNALLHHVGPGLRGIGGEARPGIVHRLDKGTTGVMVVAKTAPAHASLAAQFAGRTVTKEYLAVVLGTPPPEGVTDLAIGRSPTARTRMATTTRGGRAARTRWRVVEVFGGSAALLEVRLETGRTHQVRVHLAATGHPLVGDATYGGGRAMSCRDPGVRSLLANFPRPALHAHRLAFDHPVTGERLAFEAAVPDDLVELLRGLRAASAAP